MGRPYTGESLQFRLHLFTEPICAQGTLLLEIHSDFSQSFLRQGLLDKLAVGSVTTGVFLVQRQVSRLGRYQRVRLSQSIGTVTRSRIRGRIVNHPRPHWVEFDVSIAGQYVLLGIDQT